MPNKILTPVTLWSDFTDSLPLNPESSAEWSGDGVTFRRIRFLGREAGGERVRIYALMGYPDTGKEYPGLLILPDMFQTADEELITFFAQKGYAVFMPDYRGVWDGANEYTVYPKSIEYANTKLAGRHIDYADQTARETSWYEWVAVARYALRCMQFLGIRKTGAIGLHAGGDVLWQLAALTGDLSCAVMLCAGGWRAYRGIPKYGEEELKMDDERYRYIAAVDSQSYAQYVKCPVLMLCSTNDEEFDADRAYDTYARINPEMPKSFYFATRYNGHTGNTGLKDLTVFLDKYLRDRTRFTPDPVAMSIEEDGDDLVARVGIDLSGGELDYCDVFMSEDNLQSWSRDWTRCRLKRDEGTAGRLYYLDYYEKSERVFAYAKVRYKNGYAVSSKITMKKIGRRYANSLGTSRVIYCSSDGRDSFTVDNTSSKLMAGSFLRSDLIPIEWAVGPHGIKGIYSPYGLKTYRINDERYRPGENALLKFDVYGETAQKIAVSLFIAERGKADKYTAFVSVSGAYAWSNRVLQAKDFKNAVNRPLSRIRDAKYITFSSEGRFFINNMLWL